MAEKVKFQPQKFDINSINGGNRYGLEGIQPEAVNAPIEGSAYAIEKAENAIAKAENAIAKADQALNSIIPSGGTYPPLTAYPIGSIYMSVNNTSPAELFGGSWEKLKDKFLVGAGNLYALGATGGSADAVVVKHKHWFGTDTAAGIQVNGIGTPTIESPYTQGSNGGNNCWTAADTLIAEEGEDGTNKNLPPYLAVNIWKRTA